MKFKVGDRILVFDGIYRVGVVAMTKMFRNNTIGVKYDGYDYLDNEDYHMANKENVTLWFEPNNLLKDML